MFTVPAKVTTVLLLQIDWSIPAFTTGGTVKLITMMSVTALQLPLPVVVNVNVTELPSKSDALGV